MSDKNILVLPREYIESSFQVPRIGVKRVLIGHLHSTLLEHGMFVDRAGAESDPRYKQIIPYIVVRFPSRVPPLEGQLPPEVLHYVRTKKSGESRLRGKHSIGFGGHIKEEDGASPLTCLTRGIHREIEEELKFPATVTEHMMEFGGLINDESNDVGQVHIGLLYMLDIKEQHKCDGDRNLITTPDEDIADLKWSVPSSLSIEPFESWSQVVLRNVFKVEH